MMRFLPSVLVLVLLLFSIALLAQDDDIDVSDSGVDPKRVDAAVKKGVEWLLAKQNGDGSWTSAGTQGIEAHYPGGTTALVLFALLKGGVNPNDPRILKGFNFCFNVTKKQPPAGGLTPPGGESEEGGFEKRVYSVSCLILAIAARYQPQKPKKSEKSSKSKKKKLRTEPYEEQMRKNFARKVTPQDNKMMKELIEWLLSKQETNVWRYPGAAQDGNIEDASNTQYAMLALYTAWRLGYPIPKSVWVKVADYFLKHQEKDGPKVDWFPVPGADFPVSQLKRMEKKVLKEMAKLARKGKLDPKKMRTEVAIDNPYKKFGEEKKEMKARGWGYIPKGKAPKYPSFEKICGSMTTSGVAAMMICKAALEGTSYYKKYRKAIDQAIRDGCAWFARNFSVSTNPGKGGYHYYYLYGLERAGVLTLCRKFGEHDWYKEGAEFLLANQKGDGSWPGTDSPNAPRQGDMTSSLVNTCFAILFLKKATAPLVKIPEQIYSGEGLGISPPKK